MMIIVLHPRSDRHRSQKSRRAKPCQLNSAKGRRGLSKCGLPRAGGALPTDDYCFAPSLGQAQVPKNAGRRSLANSIVRRAGGALPNRVQNGPRSLPRFLLRICDQLREALSRGASFTARGASTPLTLAVIGRGLGRGLGRLHVLRKGDPKVLLDSDCF